VTLFLVIFNPQVPKNNFFVELFKRTCVLEVRSLNCLDSVSLGP
jgi:hypothetical protein